VLGKSGVVLSERVNSVEGGLVSKDSPGKQLKHNSRERPFEEDLPIPARLLVVPQASPACSHLDNLLRDCSFRSLDYEV
jgi:hypothetical protein